MQIQDKCIVFFQNGFLPVSSYVVMLKLLIPVLSLNFSLRENISQIKIKIELW